MNVVVEIKDPRLLLIEDPTSGNSQAIVGKSSISVHYTREVRQTLRYPECSVVRGGIGGIGGIGDEGTMNLCRDTFESLHVTVVQSEVFVLKNLTHCIPKAILDPVDVEFHYKRRATDGMI